MRALLWVVAVIAAVIVLLGLVLEAVRWLVIIGLIALAVVIISAFVRGRQSAQNYPNRRQVASRRPVGHPPGAATRWMRARRG